MGKNINRIVAVFLAMVLALNLFTGFIPAEKAITEETNSSENTITEDNSITESSEIQSYEGEIRDENGKMLVPFDVAYPEAFASGDHTYDKTALLIKMDEDFDGELTEALVACGAETIEYLCPATKGVWYRIGLSEEADIAEAMKNIRALEEVLLADYDYQVESDAIEAEIPQIETVAESNWWNSKVADNPRVGEQWYLNDCNLQETWAFLESKGINPGGSSSVVVAVIDTGVDYTHPDLAASMWKNLGEIPGNGIDDDGNGYKDDIHGCSTIGSTYDHKGDPMDDHGHGTHVAGIIGAANNKEGIVGVAYGVKIMAVKAGQATGVFNQSDIAEAIMYAYENGADVINMSFGGSACSIAVQDALETAFSCATLVASAGNDGAPNEAYEDAVIELRALPNYPAALNFVIGVMSVNQVHMESMFTNWDVFSQNSVEYEVYAPGEAILSTLPDGKYGYLSGTSMAAPIVSAIAALLRSYYTDGDMYPAKFIDGQICSTSEKGALCPHGIRHNRPMLADAYLSMTKLPKPDVYLYDAKIFDDKSISDTNNGDGFIDAGETLHIAPILYNYWGMSKDTVVTIDAIGGIMGTENPYVEILTASSDFEGVGTYSIKDQLKRDENGLVIGADEPLIVKIKEDCPNDYTIVLNVTLTCKNGLDEKDTHSYMTKGLSITFNVRNGAKFPNIIDKDTVITNDKYYILDGTCTILKGVTLTIEAGTEIQMSEGAKINSYGTLIANGSENKNVRFHGNALYSECSILAKENGIVKLNHTSLDGSLFLSVSEINNCNIIGGVLGSTLKAVVSAAKICKTYIRNCDIGAINILNCTIEESDSRTICASTIEYSTIISTGSNGLSLNASYLNDSHLIGVMGYNVHSSHKCVFQSGKYSGQLGFGDSSLLSADTDINRYYFDEKTSTGYLQIKGSALAYSMHFLEEFGNSFGGRLLCIETAEEFDMLRQRGFEGYCALKYGENKWDNGAEVGDWLTTWELQSLDISGYYNTSNCIHQLRQAYNYKAYAYLPQKSETDNSRSLNFGETRYGGLPNKIIFEIPNANNLTAEIIQQIVDNYLSSSNFHIFWKCSIINNFNDTTGIGWCINTGGASDYEDLKTLEIPNIYWGTTDLDLIEKQIIDFDDQPYERDQLDPTGFLTEAPEDAYPFVVDAYLLNADGERVRTVNNETVTFVVEFNRDMNTEIPLKVTFGSSAEYMYEDYNISEHGKWVTPRRWEATYTLKTIIENGNHTIKIENGQAVDNEWLKLYDVPGRFMFEIDTTAAQALIMQGHATETGIQLNWMQDDFDTLLGYNVYRSNKEDGYYQRINNFVIPADTKEFFDDTVEPGKVYYYNFTVVKTDLTESEPSGKISLMSMDTMAPNIYHSPVRSGFVGNKIIVSATITDNLAIRSATLYWRMIGETTWRKSEMSALNSAYTGVIYGEFVTEKGVEYYIDAYDGVSHTYKGSAETPYQIAVKLAVDATALGDVDGDGIITSKDALMLMQAANDLLNLSEEQFLRADINGDKELSASEALRILQYVSGKITTITG